MRACVPGGMWSNGTEPNCGMLNYNRCIGMSLYSVRAMQHLSHAVAIPCPVIAPPTNGRISFVSLTVTYTCNPGYTLNGPITRTCRDNRTWSLTAPTCDGEFSLYRM